MKLDYTSIKEGSSLTLTDFSCAPSMRLLETKGLYKILWTKGKDTTIVVDGYRMPLIKNQVVFCTPLNVMELRKDSGMVALVFNREFYCIRDHDQEVSCNGFLFFGSSLPPVITLNEKDIKSFEALFYMFQEEFETRDHIQGEMLRALLKRMLIKATRLIKNEMPETKLPKPQFDTVRQYHILVEQHFREKHSVAEYAELLFKSPKTLSNLFKKSGDRSPLKIINERIILEAKRLLFYSDKTAEEIGYELGFKEAAHFSKFFKNQVGSPPATFKKDFKEAL
ncbi:helix-turn-helix domain-containing protein [Flavobacteriaceae bacterium TP-CH-4]|uniref:Helix-turn-helix domain-containing protein n=1 Tax=Pelagihabitans pacificus TaxID=2696054 RepID=A0A967AVX8_9FLAO|nr:AraC family transcriptional regulator [Pelagihabitans pacificus]NHF61401.1 helix-turn-helix domain-containing protein [Pelagihabitans pacificus]